MLVAPTALVAATSSDDLAAVRRQAQSWRSPEIGIADSDLTDAALADLIATSEPHDDSFARAVTAIVSARAGHFPVVPHIDAAGEIFRSFLLHDLIDGWLYVRESDGYLHPYLIMDITAEHGDRTHGPRIKFTMEADNATVKRPSRKPRVLYFEETEIVGKTPGDILLAAGAYKETPELKAEYQSRRDVYQKIIDDGFGQQYRFTGCIIRADDYRSPNKRDNRKVVHDVAPGEIAALRMVAPSTLFDGTDGNEYGPVPVITAVRVFDLGAQDFLDVNTGDLTPYDYDAHLQDKLVLPDEQRELLNILTTDISVFTGDIIDGKSAGNVILAKGRPGVGKTLTAEVYAEVTGRPLYSIHSGSLGITAELVRKNLEVIFDRAKRWDAVLLLDEADVFVMERGLDLGQNAIVAEFLRTLEYFDGLLFLTTNRIDGVDEAILARCAAVIEYQPPGPKDARQVWQILAAGNDVVLDEDLLDDLVGGFPGITPRDIKMLLRLSLRMARHRGTELDASVFASSAAFRGLHYLPPSQR
ncbi:MULTISPECIES: AAA family ATPase [unclassified Gordonia (in: high G+C Gram-positive bacteria)]|uniref:AAA family ATPase n=1 Tax=unclassified Gordonia (in: high G+C Gram-positive bacteria) TaxID=2657482 RepID=UPI001F0E659C|nr:AAA family ATPase [Gordonia sp. ABSL49_1]MCH5645020.1 ATP-binding protein [Gordonia sp. ABSL49_1]